MFLYLLHYLGFAFYMVMFSVSTLNRQYFSKEIRRFYVFSLYDFITSVFLIAMATQGINNILYYNVIVFIGFILLSRILLQWIYPAVHEALLWVLPGIMVIYSTCFYLASDIYHINAYVQVINKLIISSLVLLFLIRHIQKENLKVLESPEFWIATGLLCFYSIDALLESAAQDILTYKKTRLAHFYTVFYVALTCIYNTLLSAGFWISRPQQKYAF